MRALGTGTAAQYDAIVVGAGLGGLSTAAFLTTNGRRTLVLEQNQVVGGCSQVFRRQGNKYEFDVGVHYIGDCAPGGTVDRLMRGLAPSPTRSRACGAACGPSVRSPGRAATTGRRPPRHGSSGSWSRTAAPSASV